jgi:membrane-associated phospholipid phosphatase
VLLLAVLIGGGFLDNLGDDAGALLSPGPAWTAGAGAAVTGAALALESGEGYEGFLGGGAPHPVSRFVQPAFGIGLLAACPAVWAGGALAGHAATEETGMMLTEAIVMDYAIVAGLKYATGRERPDGSDDLSFPSAHSTAAASTAVIAWDRWGAGAGIACSAVALAVGLCRIDLGRHHPSDVAAGLAAGAAVGLAVVHAHGDDASGGNERGIGFQLVLRDGGVIAAPW